MTAIDLTRDQCAALADLLRRTVDIIPKDIFAVCDIDIRVKLDVFCGAPLPTLEVQTHRFPQVFRPEAAAKEGEK